MRVVAKSVVLVAFVLDALTAVKFWKVDDAVAKIEAKLAVPVNVGLAEKTTLPVPVSSVRSAASSAEVSIEVLDTLLLKMVKSTDER